MSQFKIAADLVKLPSSSHAKPVDSFPESIALAERLRRVIRGEVSFDSGSRAMYASDGSNYRQIPIGVVVPRDADDVEAAIAECRKFGAPILARGAGTSLAGQSCNVAVVLDFTKYCNRILDIDPDRRIAIVQPGVVLDTLRTRAEEHHLTFAPDPSTHNRCTIGGMIGNNSCGTHALLGGKTVDNVEELDILLYDGTRMTVGATPPGRSREILEAGGREGKVYSDLAAIRDEYGDLIRARFPRIPRRVSGYNLDELLPEHGFHVARALVGTEGTCVTILQAKLRLIQSPRHRVLVGLGYEDAFQAADHVMEILQFDPIALEGFEGSIVDGLSAKNAPHLDLLPQGRGILLAEFGSDGLDEAKTRATDLVKVLAQFPNSPASRLYSKEEAKKVWRLREAGPRAAAFAPGARPTWEGWDDAAVAPEKLGAYLREIRKLINEYGYEGAFYGHFGHGCIHMRLSFDLQSETGIRKYAEFVDRAADLVVSYGGSLSGEHGDGQSRGALLPKMFGPELMTAFRKFKAVWDPAGKMNPHKVVDAYHPAENLRLGADYKPLQLATNFSYREDGGAFSSAVQRCIGVGTCRKTDSGSMCPSFMATRDEVHSTRGRAHLLFEMLQGEVITGRWKSKSVKAAMDLCLSCKACKSECPANVDLATYKAEFLSHYYQGKLRPLHDYVFGMIDVWARIGSIAPRIVNRLSHAPLSRHVLNRFLDLAPERVVPSLANRTFRDWARERGASTVEGLRHDPPAAGSSWNGRDVLLWVDTFNNYFHPETSRAAFEVLERAGFNVLVTRKHLCCGRPLYDFGMLDRARSYLRLILASIGEQIDRGVPVIVLEPSCASVFRDELCNLFPEEPRAAKLRNQTLLLGEFLDCHARNFEFPRLSRQVLLHVHCHQDSLMNSTAEESILGKVCDGVRRMDSGCCGMAGPFGFQKDKFEVAQAIGERVLLPSVRQASGETIVISDGFSCREQITQSTQRKAIHLAEALWMALSPISGSPSLPASDAESRRSRT
jgi:FAD/FMN-containing dehydrogenase/Fe-S oxidoreductase